jgi:hypothetical protein
MENVYYTKSGVRAALNIKTLVFWDVTQCFFVV